MMRSKYYYDYFRNMSEEQIKENWIKTFVECFECIGGKPIPNFSFDQKTTEKFKP